MLDSRNLQFFLLSHLFYPVVSSQSSPAVFPWIDLISVLLLSFFTTSGSYLRDCVRQVIFWCGITLFLKPRICIYFPIPNLYFFVCICSLVDKFSIYLCLYYYLYLFSCISLLWLTNIYLNLIFVIGFFFTFDILKLLCVFLTHFPFLQIQPFVFGIVTLHLLCQALNFLDKFSTNRLCPIQMVLSIFLWFSSFFLQYIHVVYSCRLKFCNPLESFNLIYKTLYSLMCFFIFLFSFFLSFQSKYKKKHNSCLFVYKENKNDN